MRSFLSMLAIGVAVPAALVAQTPREFQEDFDTAIKEIESTYAYFDAKATRWNEVSALYATDLKRVTTRDEFVALLERVVDELYDPHAQLNVNLPTSPRLVPSGADLWAEWRSGRATITQVRDDSDAKRAGIRPGMIVVTLDDVPIARAVDVRLGRSYPRSTPAARDWALRSVLAGRHQTRRLLEFQEGHTTRKVELPAADQFGRAGIPLDAIEIRPGIGYVRINDSLGDGALVAAFDRALAGFRATRGLIVDLRNTPSGGNTSVARAILGRFVAREQPYQKHSLPSEERESGVRRSWLELVSPRGDFAYSRPVVVLVGRWTGSMGEGIALGFDATRAGTVVGTAMAGLLGATYRITLPRTGISINVPAERLDHVNGMPREVFRPPVIVDPSPPEPAEDPFVSAALKVLVRPPAPNISLNTDFHRGGSLGRSVAKSKLPTDE